MNQDIKNYAKSKGVWLWQIAEVLHINDGNFSRKLRKELTEAQKQEITRIIDELAERGTQGAKRKSINFRHL